MVATYQEFAAQHRTQHLNPFNRWCAVIANYLAPVALITAVWGRPKAGAALFAFANLALVTGHVVEGNLPQAIRDMRHPIWAVRADVGVANATISDLAFRR
jgi:hypothetical protein